MDTMTRKGHEIAEYITSRNLADEGRGFLVMGTYVSPVDGHAYEQTCHVGCKTWDRETKRCFEHPFINHGKVTTPGRLYRLEK